MFACRFGRSAAATTTDEEEDCIVILSVGAYYHTHTHHCRPSSATLKVSAVTHIAVLVLFAAADVDCPLCLWPVWKCAVFSTVVPVPVMLWLFPFLACCHRRRLLPLLLSMHVGRLSDRRRRRRSLLLDFSFLSFFDDQCSACLSRFVCAVVACLSIYFSSSRGNIKYS